MNYFEEVSHKYFNKGIIVDTNILLLIIIGNIDTKRITNFKGTRQFVIEDYLLLTNYLKLFKSIMVTPQIITEVNSFLNKLENKDRYKDYESFALFIKSLYENYTESKSLSELNEFRIFGITDTSIYELAKNKYLVLTDDLKLSDYLARNNIDVINFNHIRINYWEMQ